MGKASSSEQEDKTLTSGERPSTDYTILSTGFGE